MLEDNYVMVDVVAVTVRCEFMQLEMQGLRIAYWLIGAGNIRKLKEKADRALMLKSIADNCSMNKIALSPEDYDVLFG